MSEIVVGHKIGTLSDSGLLNILGSSKTSEVDQLYTLHKHLFATFWHPVMVRDYF